MPTLDLEIVTPDGVTGPLPFTAVDVPADDGRLTVLPGHEAFACLIKEGPVRTRDEHNATSGFNVGAGSMTVKDDRVTLLVRYVTPEEQAPH